ncbi:blue-light-activated histidine kinase [Variibacter gotjawalensis]|uniref:histidine kinase n=1 Tax=Variibacter gotjawalensis TaxID=1333996 RepID=A0A0S3PQ96_9BRAD|nr:GAF domain-containing protein [Variibacter gotjawalensis]RZS50213.1 two-component sensor histidine kinase [Variibacter gotjawalensis]BAT58044.1 blue-light-activated histidine kinase [Variibacter gotjawalensis]
MSDKTSSAAPAEHAAPSAIPSYVYDPERLKALDGYAILDTEPEPGFDDIVQLAMFICEAPVALVSLVTSDRQWFKAHAGFEPCETDLNSSVCAHVLVERDVLVINDLTKDRRTSANPLVMNDPGIRFYAGAPLANAEGHVLGSLCVIDTTPRPQGLSAAQVAGLRQLASQVISQLELRRAVIVQRGYIVEQQRAEVRRNALLQIGDKLRDAESMDEVTQFASSIVAATLGASRAGFGLLSEDGEYVDIAQDWTSEDQISVSGRHRFADYGRLADDLIAGLPLVISDVTTDERTAADPSRLLKLNIRSLINLVVFDHGRPAALFFVHFDTVTEWPQEVLTFLRNVADRVENGVARLKAERQQRVLNHELSHRMKNTMAMVQAVARQTLKGLDDKAAVDAFVDRLHALSAAHDVLLAGSWLSADLREVVGNVTAALGSDRFKLTGAAMTIGPRATLSLSLLLHELSTNAVKYGALSNDLGVVDLSWRVDDATKELVIDWRESGGPTVGPPSQKGFGSRLIAMGLIGTGGVTLSYHTSGLHGEFRAPLLEVQAS